LPVNHDGRCPLDAGQPREATEPWGLKSDGLVKCIAHAGMAPFGSTMALGPVGTVAQALTTLSIRISVTHALRTAPLRLRRWRRGHWPPTSWALLDKGVVALRMVAMVPRRLERGGLDDHRGRRLNDHRRIAIGIPVWPPERAEADADWWAAQPVELVNMMDMSKIVEAMVEPMAAEPMPAPPGVPYSRACAEQRPQHDDDPRPLLPSPYSDPLPLMICDGALPLALDRVRWPFNGALLRTLPISDVNRRVQAHLIASPNG
jgi:hypothetical protein